MNHKDNFSTLFAVTAFKNSITNWISWSQGTDYIWRPSNTDSVEIWGVEATLKSSYKYKHGQIGLSLAYTYQRAKNTITEYDLPYVPKAKTAPAFNFAYKNTVLVYNHSFTTMQYTNASNLSSLPAHDAGYLALEHSIAGSGLNTVLSLKINNLWDSNYQTKMGYPMPGRYFELGAIFNIK